MSACLIGLGSNLGDRAETLSRAVSQLLSHPSIRVLARSGWRETRPVGGPGGQGAFLNGAVLLDTSLGPRELLAELRAVERTQGRKRGEHWAARTLDLDLLL